MDSLIVDVTALPDGMVAPGTAVELIGDHQTVDDLANAMTTIGDEVLSSFGHRFTRVYRDDVANLFPPLLAEGPAS